MSEPYYYVDVREWVWDRVNEDRRPITQIVQEDSLEQWVDALQDEWLDEGNDPYDVSYVERELELIWEDEGEEDE